MLCDAHGHLGDRITVEDRIAKRGGGRVVPLNPELRKALGCLHRQRPSAEGPVILSERGTAMQPGSIVNWFAKLYRAAGLAGCSSHSGRRTFITSAARLVHKSGGSLRDVQQLAGHRSISMTQRYIEGDEEAKRRLVRLL
jgi:integrase/recombinase XerD